VTPVTHPELSPQGPEAANGPAVPAAGAGSPAEGYTADDDSHLRDELTRIAFLVQAFLLRASPGGPTPAAGRNGDGLPPEFEAVLLDSFQWDGPATDPNRAAKHAACLADAARLDRHIVDRLRRTRDEDRYLLPGWELARRIGLVPDLAATVKRPGAGENGNTPEPVRRNTLALDVVLLALLVDRYPAYRAALAAAAGPERTDAGLTVETALRILDPAAPAKLRWQVFAPTGPLLANDLVAIGPGEQLGRRSVRVEPRIAAFLLKEDPPPDPVLAPAMEVVHQVRTWDRVRLDAGVIDQLRRASEWWWTARDGSTLMVLLQGPPGTPFLDAVQAFLTWEARPPAGPGVFSRPVLLIDSAAARSVIDWDGFVRKVYREAVLRRGVVLWARAETLLAGDPGQGTERWDAVVRRAEQAGPSTFVASRVGWEPAEAFRGPNRYFVRIDLPTPSPPIRRAVWKSRLARVRVGIAADATPADRAALDLLETFEFTQGEIEDAIGTYRGLALVAPPAPDDGKAARTVELLAEACRRQAARRPVPLARRVPPPRPTPGEDPRAVLRERVVLPAAAGMQLSDLYDRMYHVSRVYHDLGLGQQQPLARGVVALFTGPPGTGKTLAATTLAGLLQKDLYKVDTAAVMSRSPGETERNLDRVFTDVQGASAVLFFDEAEALFGKRGDVVQPADRWANFQVSYLLQRIEEYTGTVILATNSRESIDAAFFRRMHVLIEFPKPAAADRLRIFEGLVAQAGLRVADAAGRVVETAEEVRGVLKPVADRFDLSGGNIRNVVLDAAFRGAAGAAGAAGPPVVSVRELVLGVAREYQKEGWSVSVMTFGKDWFGLLERDFKLGRGI